MNMSKKQHKTWNFIWKIDRKVLVVYLSSTVYCLPSLFAHEAGAASLAKDQESMRKISAAGKNVHSGR